jgi:hypothetical protein
VSWQISKNSCSLFVAVGPFAGQLGAKTLSIVSVTLVIFAHIFHGMILVTGDVGSEN